MKTPVLETERLLLRPLSIEDADDIFARWTSDDRVSKYVRWCTHSSVEDTRQWLEMEIRNYESDKAYQWGFTLKETGYLFGSGGLVFNETEGVFELGYNIMYDLWRQGYTTEAAKAMIDFAHRKLGQKEFVACHAVNNPASGAVMRKCGFVYEKNEIHTKFDGATSDNMKYYRLRIEET